MVILYFLIRKCIDDALGQLSSSKHSSAAAPPQRSRPKKCCAAWAATRAPAAAAQRPASSASREQARGTSRIKIRILKGCYINPDNQSLIFAGSILTGVTSILSNIPLSITVDISVEISGYVVSHFDALTNKLLRLEFHYYRRKHILNHLFVDRTSNPCS